MLRSPDPRPPPLHREPRGHLGLWLQASGLSGESLPARWGHDHLHPPSLGSCCGQEAWQGRGGGACEAESLGGGRRG